MIWAQKDFDDTGWEERASIVIDGRFWVRAGIVLDRQARRSDPLGLFVVSMGAFECYFDGQLIGRSGVLGRHRAEETPGKTVSYLAIPDTLAGPGRHVIALRVSSHFAAGKTKFFQFYVGDYFELVRKPLILTAYMYILAGIFFIVAVYYFFLFWQTREAVVVLVFSICCFLFFALILVEYLKFYVLYPYPYQYPRMSMIRWITVGLAVLIPYFFYLQFPFRRRFPYLGIYLGILALFVGIYFQDYDELSQTASLLMGLFSVIWVGRAARNRQKGSRTILIGLSVCALVVMLFYYDVSLFLSFGVIILVMLYLLARRMQEQKKAYDTSKLLSARLEAELLKKNIQPHFLMNTLTSLIDWVEEAPHMGVRFIELLAGEFEILSRIANQKQISVREEIELCKTHLEVMTFRKEVNYCWEEENVDPEELIPPALIHTALENGITHNLPLDDGRVVFRLVFENRPGSKRYILLTFGKPRKKHQPIVDGTGLQYMRARLEENYPSRWSLLSESIPRGWQTVITIYRPIL